MGGEHAMNIAALFVCAEMSLRFLMSPSANINRPLRPKHGSQVETALAVLL